MASGAGLCVLGGSADRVGLAESLSAALPSTVVRVPVYGRGVFLTRLHSVLTRSAEARCDIEHLRGEVGLFAPAESDSTLWRVLTGIDEVMLAELCHAVRRVRERP